MIEGFWILQILPPPVTTGGVILFMKGKLFGGDNGFTWVGTYSVTSQMLRGRARVHNFDSEIKSVLGIEGDYDMHFSGMLEGNVIIGTAMIAGQPQHSLAIRMEKYANL